VGGGVWCWGVVVTLGGGLISTVMIAPADRG
jgi:hypothetical protein